MLAFRTALIVSLILAAGFSIAEMKYAAERDSGEFAVAQRLQHWQAQPSFDIKRTSVDATETGSITR